MFRLAKVTISLVLAAVLLAVAAGPASAYDTSDPNASWCNGCSSGDNSGSL